MQLTYEKQRACLYCNEPIADQEHASRLYCERTEEIDGSVKSCKDDHHAALRKLEMGPFLAETYFYRDQDLILGALWQEGQGRLRNLEELNRTGLQLNRALNIEKSESGLWTFYFHRYAVMQASSLTYKIVTNEQIFQ